VFLDELKMLLVNAGVDAKDIFLSTKASIPKGDGPFTTITSTGGTSPSYVQNQRLPHVAQPGAQILVRASSYKVANDTAKEIMSALSNVRSENVDGTYYQRISVTQSEPIDMGLDETSRARVAFNIIATKQP
jgi:hypothetical protein